MVRACHTPRQPLQNHPSGHLGGWATPWSAEEMLDGQHQRVDIPAHAGTAHKGLLQKRLEEKSLLNRPSCPPDDLIGQGTELNGTTAKGYLRPINTASNHIFKKKKKKNLLQDANPAPQSISRHNTASLTDVQMGNHKKYTNIRYLQEMHIFT